MPQNIGFHLQIKQTDGDNKGKISSIQIIDRQVKKIVKTSKYKIENKMKSKIIAQKDVKAQKKRADLIL